jgi:cyclophilin family peptidyl-prolyl cis-trans isomerase
VLGRAAGLALALSVAVAGCGANDPRLRTLGPAECPFANGSSPRYIEFPDAPPDCVDENAEYTAVVDTDVGRFVIELFAERAPVAVNSFVFLARYHYFDGLPFHRVIPDFVVQAGDATGSGLGGPGYTFADELPSKSEYGPGSVAMANAGPDTNGGQFFILMSERAVQSLLLGLGNIPVHTLFGEVVQGFSVVERINADGDVSGAPKVVHTIRRVTIRQRLVEE